MPHGGPHDDEMSYSIDPDLETDFMSAYGLQPYQEQLGRFQLEAPQLLERSAARERQALEQARRTGMMSLAEQAAQARAATVGGAGQMALGGGRAAQLRQSGLSFGRQAADFAADAFQRAAGLEADITNRRLQLMGEALPGAALAQAEAQRSLQNDVVYLQEYLETLKDNYSKREQAEQLRGFLDTMPSGSARNLAAAELARMEEADRAAAERARILADQKARGVGIDTEAFFARANAPRPGEPGYEYVDPYA